MNYKELAEQIIACVGGAENLVKVNHCATRLRFTIKDTSLIRDDEIKKMKGVLSTISRGTNYQVVIGTEVGNVYRELPLDKVNGNEIDNAKSNSDATITQKVKNIFRNGLDVLSSCMVPLVPALVAAGMLNVVITLIKLTGVIGVESTTYQLINTMANSGFYFLPMLVAATAAKRFQGSMPLALVCVGILIHPNFTALVGGGEAITLFGLPVAAAAYGSQVFPAVLTVWFMSVVEHFMDKHLPTSIKYFTKPLATVFITSCISLVVLAPLGYYISQVIAGVFMVIQEKCGWISVMILSLPLPFLVMTGTHKAISPIAMALYTTLGYDSFFLISFLGFNFSQGSAALAVAMKTKNKELKQTGYASAVSGLLAGITEPALYGISLKLKRPLYASMIGSACAGLFSGIMGVKLFTYAGPCLVTLPAFISSENPANFIYACISAAIAVGVTFVLTWIFGWDEAMESIE